jgi:hypothetical protein
MKQRIIFEARTWLGTSFCHQGRLKKSLDNNGACDCLGLIMEVAKSLDLQTLHNLPFVLLDRLNYSSIPDSNELKYELDTNLTKIDSPEEGDITLLSFLGQPQHLAFIGRDNTSLTLIHAYMPSGRVCEHIFDQKWQRRVVAFYRFSF